MYKVRPHLTRNASRFPLISPPAWARVYFFLSKTARIAVRAASEVSALAKILASRPIRSGTDSTGNFNNCLVARKLPRGRSEEHTSELQSRPHLVCRLLLEKKKKKKFR